MQKNIAARFVLSFIPLILACGCAGPLPAAQAEEPPVVLIGAGDIANCETQHDEQTAALIAGYPEAAVFSIGDNAYGEGTREDFDKCFEPSWGPLKDRLRPVPGNHDYKTNLGLPYYDYFGEAAGEPGLGYYSYELGSWHIVTLNSNCTQVDCGPGSAQVRWLYEDLRLNKQRCTLLYWHHPYWSTDAQQGSSTVETFWKIANRFRAEVVVNGHDHFYERYAPMNSQSKYDKEGVRMFIVGTGGSDLHALPEIRPNNIARDNSTFGVIKFNLYSSRYEWEFIPTEGGQFTDSGAGECH